MSGDDDDPVESAPDGADCEKHPERSALVVCPRCGSHCCIACWHGAVRRCHACLLREPPDPPPWADLRRSLPGRFFGTLLDAFRPRLSAPALTGGRWREARSFALLTLVPLGLLAGIIPFTHTLRFGPSWTVAFVGHNPSTTELGFDIGQAAALGLLMSLVKLALIAAPFLSLTRAYGQPTEASPPRQMLLYRAWLVPLAGRKGILFQLALWGASLEPDESFMFVADLLSLAALFLLIFSMRATARISGVGPFVSLVIAMIPIIVLALVEPLVLVALEPILPNVEVIQQSVEASTP